ncbi:glycosyltransferase, group 1 family protein [Bifidobacterium actinocoloniiforme DSM 22766]|uniref:Glycosyltransferase, group 1 family protein n=1 Tax=Bifidobacterium actinocoloniiforme DSM 22766 TaxID=1437605 RepID=A0A086Z1Y4_9BIFI|nr:glycosyltransferase [Bifidobacterium actinocoloniiforme]AKV55627.1 glycosyl transferase [Bifidobacterium actinocoloniiforme DSM 22766]KFI40534.1 glycosyltransferase, group 1 family protein [Bifidobacterium actinocoloniiforme DSM 22766]
MLKLFDVDESVSAAIEKLSPRLRALVLAALNYHSLIQPGRELSYRLYMGERWQYPRLTDTSTLSGDLTERAGLTPFLEFRAKSAADPSSEFSPHYFEGQQQIIDRNVRYILLSPDGATDEDIEAKQTVKLASKVYRACETYAPVAFDYIREAQRSHREKQSYQPIVPFVPQDLSSAEVAQRLHHPYFDIKPNKPREGAPKAVLVGMHWLQAGGAERWGLETIDLVKRAGMTPIVITNMDSHQPWISKPELEGALVICLTFPMQERPGDEPLLRSIFEQFDVRGTLIHHNQWLYDRLWWIKRYYPQTRIVDSLHILEYRYRGGYPNQAVSRDAYIDLHHVISPQLENWLVERHGISQSKIVMAPLVGLTADTGRDTIKARQQPGQLCVAFVGRVTRQKRPEAFIRIVQILEHAHPGAYHFIMHGNGDLDGEVNNIIEHAGLTDVIERRGLNQSVEDTYQEADLLLVSSVNEGITLTTIEAISAGLPVLSADVGSQSTLIPVQGLLPRRTADLIAAAVRSMEHIREHEEDRERLWQVENARLTSFFGQQSANRYFQNMLKEWAQ